MHFSKISVAAISMALLSLASAAPATQAAPIEARSNCFGDAIAAGSSCAVDCFKQGGDTGDPLSWLRSHPLTVCSNHRFHHPLPPAADTNATVPVLTITPLGDDVPATTTRPTPKTLSTSQTAARAATTSSASTSTTSRTGCRATTRRRGFSSPTGSRALGASEPPASPSTTTGSFWTACSCGGSLAGPSLKQVLKLKVCLQESMMLCDVFFSSSRLWL
ncbi:hypothetical protein OOU_Y34scaffold00148g20 [Pyricularia oryzae Y34]|uniref:Uncharacterized protein n=2 Tax=Pyricularia oryzae TaxID=318829 RepID=A0AA97PQS2_PYRO3|nr:hypothetical protein OOU_Y34scaffold00148g20 [Pyricularia oryzae Y34]